MKHFLIIPVLYSFFFNDAFCQNKEFIPPVEVKIYTNEEVLPPNISKIGNVKVGYPPVLLIFYMINFQYKSYFEVLKKMQSRAIKMGGNMVVLKKHQLVILGKPEYHYVRGEVYFMEEPPMKKSKYNLENEVLLHIYNFREYLPNKGLYVNDSLVMELQHNFKRTIKLKKTKFLSLEFENQECLQIKLDSLSGNEFYIRCMGCSRHNCDPVFKLMPLESGRLEFESFKAKNK